MHPRWNTSPRLPSYLQPEFCRRPLSLSTWKECGETRYEITIKGLTLNRSYRRSHPSQIHDPEGKLVAKSIKLDLSWVDWMARQRPKGQTLDCCFHLWNLALDLAALHG